MRSIASRRATAAYGVLCFALVAAAAPGSTTIPFDAGFGSHSAGPMGAVTPLAATSFLACVYGPDDAYGTGDDVTLLVKGLGGTPELKALPTPHLSRWGPWPTPLSATRCALPGAGPDGAWTTADDVVFVLERLGSDDVVTQVTVGWLDPGEGHRPIALGPRTFVVATFGPDGDSTTADDTVVLVSDAGRTNSRTNMPAPYLPESGRSRPVALSLTSFIVLTAGADEDDATSDDAAYLFTKVGGANERTTIDAPYQFRHGASSPVRLSPTRVVVSSVGADGEEETGDDVLLLLDRLGTKNTVTTIPVSGLGSWGAGMGIALDDDTLLVATLGEDLEQKTSDDALLLVERIGARKQRLTEIVVGYLDDDAASRPVRLAEDAVAVSTCGADEEWGSADDRIALVADLGGANSVSFVSVPGLSEGIDGRAVPLGADSFLVANGGPDAVLGAGDDDRITMVTDAFGTPGLTHFASVGDADEWSAAHLPRVLGRGRAAFASPGEDDDFGGGADDVFQVLDGLPASRDLEVDRMDLLFSSGAPTRPARISVKARLRLDDLVPDGAFDVTISVGNAAQTIPAKSFRRRGKSSVYTDAKGKKGFLTKVSFNAKTSALEIKGKGLGTDVETTHADYVPVAISFGDLQLADPCTATQDAEGLHFKR